VPEKKALTRTGQKADNVVVLTDEQKEILARVSLERNLLYRAKCSDFK